MATFYKFGKLWEIPPAAARLRTSLPANTQAFETFLTNLEPMYSGFITAHPRCPKDPDLPAIRYAIKEFMEEQAPSNFMKERWAASYDPARKVTYVSWFLGTVAYFLDKLDFTSLVPPPVETEFPVFIAEPPSAPLDPAPPQRHNRNCLERCFTVTLQVLGEGGNAAEPDIVNRPIPRGLGDGGKESIRLSDFIVGFAPGA